jgi:mannonate dehydratase
MTRRDTFKLSLLAAGQKHGTGAPAGQRAYEWMPQLSDNTPDCEPQTLRWLRQLGCEHVIFVRTDNVDKAKKGYWTKDDVLRQKVNCDALGMTLLSMMIPIGFYKNALLGQKGRDEDIDNIRRTIRAAAEAGVPMLEWRFWPDFFWDERVGYYEVTGRGGSKYRANDYTRIAGLPPFPGIGVVSAEEMWDRLLYFAKPVMEEAEQTGVKLSMHPCDPPIANMRGSARIFAHPDGMRRFLKEVPGKANGFTFCQGAISEMGVDLFDEIRYFASRKRVNLVHFRTVRGVVPKYTEVFIDEGDIDMIQAMKVWKESGYSGPMVSDHTPKVEGDTPWGHIGRSFSLGFMRAAAQAVNTLSS